LAVALPARPVDVRSAAVPGGSRYHSLPRYRSLPRKVEAAVRRVPDDLPCRERAGGWSRARRPRRPFMTRRSRPDHRTVDLRHNSHRVKGRHPLLSYRPRPGAPRPRVKTSTESAPDTAIFAYIVR
jgi:hypothetical protein